MVTTSRSGTLPAADLNRLCEKCQSLFSSEWSAMPVEFYTRDFSWRLAMGQEYMLQPINTDELDAEAAELSEYLHPDHELLESGRELHDAVINLHGLQPFFHHNLRQLQTSAERGCHFCAAVRYALLSDKAPDFLRGLDGMPQQLQEAIDILPLLFDGDDTVAIWIWTFHRSSLARPFSLHVIFDMLPAAATFQVKSRSTAGIRERTLSYVTQWISDCRLGHSRCRAPAALQAQVVPPRLLRIREKKKAVGREEKREEDSKKAQEDMLSVQLIETEEHPEVREYATLSHCWGRTSTKHLTHETYQKLARGTFISDLARTFREAVVACHALGISYLWADTLCILQDDRKDWKHHAGVMAYIYANALVSLAATYSENSDGGLFGQAQDALILNPPIAEVEWHGDRELQGTYTVHRRDLWSSHVDEAPLNWRGWVFQEALIAPRILHFASDQIRWQCKESRGSETMPVIDVTKVRGLRDIDEFPRGRWPLIVEEYKKLALTDDTDILAALAGIATAFGHEAGFQPEDYLAGLWKPALPQQLLWTSFFGRRRTDNLVPSWSWASIYGEELRKGLFYAKYSTYARPDHTMIHPQFALLHASANDSGSNPFTEARGAYLHLCGLLHSVSIVRPTEEATSVLHIGTTNRRLTHSTVDSFPVTPDEEKDADAAALDFGPSKTRWQVFYDVIDDKDARAQRITTGYLLPLLYLRTYYDAESIRFKGTVYGLLLARTTGVGMYRRIGRLSLGNSSNSKQGTSFDEDLSDLPEWHQGSELASADYLRDHGGGCYEFKIV